MGSFFLHDDYRLPDFNNVSNGGGLAYKKDNNQSIFENNLCFANIKRGLGFGGEDMPAQSSGATTSTETDDWTYNRARSSPVVERLILEEIQNDIAEYAITIGVTMDPKQWCVEDTRKWLMWVSELYQISDPRSYLPYDGRTLCGFSEQDFILLTGSEDAGLKIAAQLDLWKNAIRMTPSAGSYHFQQQQQQQAMDHKLGTPSLNRQDNNTPKLLDSACAWTPNGNQFSLSGMLSNNGQYGINEVNNTSVSSPTYQEMRSQSFQPYTAPISQVPSYMGESQGRNTPRSTIPMDRFLNDLPGRHTPRPTIPLDRFRSVREACQDNGFLTWEKFQEFTNMTPSRNSQNMFMNGKNSNQMANPMANAIPSHPYNMNKLKEEPLKPIPIASTLPPKLDVPSMSNIEPEEPPIDYTTLSTVDLKTEKLESAIDLHTEPPPPKPPAEKIGPKKKSTKHPIHLWEFLKQLLYDGKECIRWIDQEKGVFKIYNSQEVAKFWGERKNRPAMNYDKLSRSIRQYYKKGIIKKTSQGKRLVYQFCPGYL